MATSGKNDVKFDISMNVPQGAAQYGAQLAAELLFGGGGAQGGGGAGGGTMHVEHDVYLHNDSSAGGATQPIDMAPLLAAAEKMEQGVSQLAAIFGKESQNDQQFADWRGQIDSLRRGSDEYYSAHSGRAMAQRTIDNLNEAFSHRGNFSKWVNGQVNEMAAVSKWAGLIDRGIDKDWRSDVKAAAARSQKYSDDPAAFMYGAMDAMHELKGYKATLNARLKNEKGMTYDEAAAMRKQAQAEKRAATIAAKQEKAAQQTQQTQQTEAKKNAKAQKDATKTAEKTQAGQIAQAAEKKAEQAEKRADKAERREQATQQAQQAEAKKSSRSKGTTKAAKQDQTTQQEKAEEKKTARSDKRAAKTDKQEQAAQQAQRDTAREVEKTTKQAAKNAKAAASAQEDEAKSVKKTARSKKQEAREEQREQASQQAEAKQTAKSAKKSAEKAAEQEATAQQPAAQKKTKAAKQSEPQQTAPTEQTGKGKTTVKTNGDVNIDGAKTANVQGTQGGSKKSQLNEAFTQAINDMEKRGGIGGRGGGKGGGGTPGGTGGGGSDSPNKGVMPYYKNLDELNAMLNANGLGGIAQDIQTQLAASKASVTGITTSYDRSGALTDVKIDTQNVELGKAGAGALKYGIRQTEDDGLQWQASYTGAVSQAKLSEAVTKELARQEKAADKALADTRESRLANRLPRGQLAGVEAAQARYQKNPTAENLKAYYDQAVAAKGAIKDLKEDDFWGKESAKLFAKEDALVRMGADRNGGLKQWTKEQQDAYQAIEKMQDKMAAGIGGRNTAWSKDMPRMDAMLKDLDASLKATAKAEAQATQAATKAGQARLAEERAADKAAVDDAQRAAKAWNEEMGRVTQQASDVMNSTNFGKIPQALQDAFYKAYEEFDKTGMTDRGLMEKLQAATEDASAAMKASTKMERDANKDYESLTRSDLYTGAPKSRRDAMEQARTAYENDKTYENLQAYAASVKAVNESVQGSVNSKYWAEQQAKLDGYKESLQQMQGKNGGFSEWTKAQQDSFFKASGKLGEMQKAINSQNMTMASDASKAFGGMSSSLGKSLNESGKLIDRYNQTISNELFKGVGGQLQKNLDKAFGAFKTDGSAKSANALGTALDNVQTAMKGIKADDTFRVQDEKLQTLATRLDTMSKTNGDMARWSEAQKSSFKDVQGSYAALAQMQGYKLTEGMALPGGGVLTRDMMNNLAKFGTFSTGMQIASQQEAQFRQATAQQKHIDAQNRAAERAAQAQLVAERKEAAAAEKEALNAEQRAQSAWEQEAGKVTGAASKAMDNKYFGMLSESTQKGLTNAFERFGANSGERSYLNELQKETEKANDEIATFQKQEQSLKVAYIKAQGDKLYGKTPEDQRTALERDFKAYKEAPTAETLKAAQDSLRTVQESLGQQKEWAGQVAKATDKANGVMNSPNFPMTQGATQDGLKKALDEFKQHNTEQAYLDNLKSEADKASAEMREAAATRRAADKAYNAVQADKMYQTTPQEKRDAVESTKQALEQAPSAENLRAYSDAVKALSDSAKEAAKTEADTIKAFDAARASSQWGNVPEAKRTAAEQAFATYSQDKTAENLQAFSNSVRDVQGAIGAQQDANYWANQSKQLENYREQLNQLATGKNGGLDNWTQAQKDSLKQIENMQSQMAQAIAGGNKAGTEDASKQISSMTKGLEESLGKSSTLIDQYNKTINDNLFKGVGDNLKNQLNDAFSSYKADGSVESANALSAALNNVKTAMDGIQSSQAFAQQDQQLQTLASQLYAMSGKNGGFDKWNSAQQSQFQNLQTTYAALQQMQGYQMTPGMSLPGGGMFTEEMAQRMQNMPFSDFKGGMQMARQQTQQFNNMLRAATPSVGGMGTQVDALSKYLTQMAAPMMMWRRFTNLTKKAAANVAAIDTQMADLKKVTNNTDAEYDKFLTSTGENAVAVGAKISDLVATTSTFAHMGYSLSESQQLGVTATKFANVGNFQNTTDAADSMIAVIKGFDDLNIGDAELVGDKLTAVANNYAVTADDIATGLQKSASSLNMAGNNVDQSTAMITAIAEVTRDAGAAGSALKVLSARIRGAKTEITDAGESTEGMAESTSKLRSKVKALTNVDGSGGVDIMEDEDTFRSTYDIMKDISGKWGQMSDVNQAALLELLAGKVRSNQVAALLSNFDQAEAALQTSQNAEGTMNQVHQAWMGSVAAKKAQFQAAGETLSMTALPAKDLAGLYQTGTDALGALNWMIGNTGSLGTLLSTLAVTSALRSGQGNIAAGWGNIFGLHWNGGNGGPLLTKANAGWINSYNAAYAGFASTVNPATGQLYTAEQSKLMAAQAAGGAESLDKYTKSLYMNTQGTIDATKATGRLGASLVSFGKNVAAGVVSFGAMQLGMAMLNSFGQWFSDNVSNRSATLKEQTQQSYAEYKTARNEVEQKQEEIKEAQKRVAALEEKEREGTATTSDQGELDSLRSQIRNLQFQQQLAQAQMESAARETAENWYNEQHHQETMSKTDLRGRSINEGGLLTWLVGQLPKGAQDWVNESFASLSEWAEGMGVEINENGDWVIGGVPIALDIKTGSSDNNSLLADADKKMTPVDRIKAKADQLTEAYDDMINDRIVLNSDAVASYRASNAAYEQFMKEVSETAGAAEALADYDNYTNLESKRTAAEAAYGSRVSNMRDTALMLLNTYATSGGSLSTQVLGAMARSFEDYFDARESMSKGSGYDALVDLFEASGIKPLSEAMSKAIDMARQGTLTQEALEGITLGDGTKAGELLSGVLGFLGYDATSLSSLVADRMNRDRQEKSSGKAAAEVDHYEDRKAAYEGTAAAREAAEKLWKSQGFTGNLDTTSKDYEALVNADDGAYRAAIEYANGGLFFNKDKFDELVQNKYKEELAGLRKNVVDTQKKYAEAATKVLNQIKENGVADEQDVANLQKYGSQLRGLADLESQMRYGMSDYANWLNNKGGPESGDVFDELTSAATAVREGHRSGKVGTREFAAAMQFLTGGSVESVKDLNGKDWSYITGLSGVNAQGEADKDIRESTLKRIQREMGDAGILDEKGAIAQPGITTAEIAKTFNDKYGTHFGSEFFQSVFMGLNDYIEDASKKYDVGGMLSQEEQNLLAAQKNFNDAIDQYNANRGGPDADKYLQGVQQASEDLNKAYNEYKLRYGAPEEQMEAAQALSENGSDGDKEDPAVALTLAIDGLSAAVSGLTSYLKEQQEQKDKEGEEPPESEPGTEPEPESQPEPESEPVTEPEKKPTEVKSLQPQLGQLDDTGRNTLDSLEDLTDDAGQDALDALRESAEAMTGKPGGTDEGLVQGTEGGEPGADATENDIAATVLQAAKDAAQITQQAAKDSADATQQAANAQAAAITAQAEANAQITAAQAEVVAAQANAAAEVTTAQANATAAITTAQADAAAAATAAQADANAQIVAAQANAQAEIIAAQANAAAEVTTAQADAAAAITTAQANAAAEITTAQADADAAKAKAEADKYAAQQKSAADIAKAEADAYAAKTKADADIEKAQAAADVARQKADAEQAKIEAEQALSDAQRGLTEAQEQAQQILADAEAQKAQREAEIEQMMTDAQTQADQIIANANELQAQKQAEIDQMGAEADAEFARKQTEIGQMMADAQADAARILAEAEAKKAEMQAEIDQMMTDAQTQADQLVQDAQAKLQEANEQAQKIIDDANQQAQDEAQAQKEQMLAEAQAEKEQMLAEAQKETDAMRAQAEEDIATQQADLEAELQAQRDQAQADIDKMLEDGRAEAQAAKDQMLAETDQALADAQSQLAQVEQALAEAQDKLAEAEQQITEGAEKEAPEETEQGAAAGEAGTSTSSTTRAAAEAKAADAKYFLDQWKETETGTGKGTVSGEAINAALTQHEADRVNRAEGGMPAGEVYPTIEAMREAFRNKETSAPVPEYVRPDYPADEYWASEALSAAQAAYIQLPGNNELSPGDLYNQIADSMPEATLSEVFGAWGQAMRDAVEQYLADNPEWAQAMEQIADQYAEEKAQEAAKTLAETAKEEAAAKEAEKQAASRQRAETKAIGLAEQLIEQGDADYAATVAAQAEEAAENVVEAAENVADAAEQTEEITEETADAASEAAAATEEVAVAANNVAAAAEDIGNATEEAADTASETVDAAAGTGNVPEALQAGISQPSLAQDAGVSAGGQSGGAVLTPSKASDISKEQAFFNDYVAGLVERAHNVKELMALDNEANGGLGLLAEATGGDLETLKQVMKGYIPEAPSGIQVPGAATPEPASSAQPTKEPEQTQPKTAATTAWEAYKESLAAGWKNLGDLGAALWDGATSLFDTSERSEEQAVADALSNAAESFGLPADNGSPVAWQQDFSVGNAADIVIGGMEFAELLWGSPSDTSGLDAAKQALREKHPAEILAKGLQATWMALTGKSEDQIIEDLMSWLGQDQAGTAEEAEPAEAMGRKAETPKSESTTPETESPQVNGNVDLANRKKIPGQKMAEAGWSDFEGSEEGDYATLYSSTYSGNGMTVLATPISADGTVYSPDFFEDYVGNLLEQASTIEELLNLDKTANGGLGLLAAAMAGDTEDVIQAMSNFGEELHNQQEELYSGGGTEQPEEPTAAQAAPSGVRAFSKMVSPEMKAAYKQLTGEDIVFPSEAILAAAEKEIGWTPEGHISYDDVRAKGWELLAQHVLDTLAQAEQQTAGEDQTAGTTTTGTGATGTGGQTTGAATPDTGTSPQQEWFWTRIASLTEDINQTSEQLGPGNFQLARDVNTDRVFGNSKLFSAQGMTAIATNVAENGTILSAEELENYVNGLMQQAKSIDELLGLDRVENGGLGLLWGAAEGDSEEVVDAMQALTNGLNLMYDDRSRPGVNGDANITPTELASAQPAVTAPEAETPLLAGEDSAEIEVTADTSAAEGAIAGLSGMTVTVNVVASTSGVAGAVAAAAGGGGGAAAAKGTRHSEPGTYLVDEDGAELIEHRDTGTYELGTNKGARFVRLNAGDIVHTAAETRRIMRRRGGRGLGEAAANGAKVTVAIETDAWGIPNPAGRKMLVGGSVDVNATSIRSGGEYVTTRTQGLTGAEMNAIRAAEAAAAEEARRLRNFRTDYTPYQVDNAGDILKWLKKLIDWIPTYLAVLKKRTTELIGAADDALHYLTKNKTIDSAIDNVAQEINANVAAVMRYRTFLADYAIRGNLSDELIATIQNGDIDITQYKDENTVKAIQGYQQYWEKLKACLDTISALNDQMEELSKQKLDNVVNYFDQIDSLLQDQKKTFESLVDLKKQYGQELTTADYTNSLDALTQMLENARSEEAALLKELTEQLGTDGDLVQALLASGRDVWDAIAEHVIKPEDTGFEELREQIQIADETGAETVAETRARMQREDWQTTKLRALGMLNMSGPDNAVAVTIDSIAEDYAGIIPVDIDELGPARPDITPATDEEIREIGTKLGYEMYDGSAEALENFEKIKALFTTTWETPLAIGSEVWYQYMSTLENLQDKIISTKIEIGEMNDEIANIPLNNLKTGYEYLDDIRQSFENVNSLLEAQGSPKSQGTYKSLISVGMKQIENLQEQNKLLEEQMSQLDPLSEKYRELRDDLSSNLDTIASIRENQEEWNDAIIDIQIDRLRKQNDAYKEQLNLMHALNDLEDARQRRIMTYREGEGFVYEVDEDALEAAQESATDAIYSSLISSLEDAKEHNNIYGPLGERLITGSSILDMFGNTLVPVEDKLSGLDFTPYYQSILTGVEQSGLLSSILSTIDMTKMLEAAVSGDVNIDLSGMTLNGVNDAQELGDAIIQQLPNYLLQYLYQKGAN